MPAATTPSSAPSTPGSSGASATTETDQKRVKSDSARTNNTNKNGISGASQLPRAMFNQHNYFTDKVMPILGGIILFACLPSTMLDVSVCVAWHYFDYATFGALNFIKSSDFMNSTFYPIFDRFVKFSSDNFIVPMTVWLGVCIPGVMLVCGVLVNTYPEVFPPFGTNFMLLLAAFNILRIGPMYLHFGYVYATSHKEAHTYGNIFKCGKGRGVSGVYFYNYWIGMFYGVLPGTFTTSHIHNHHKYSNSLQDVYSTAGYARDSFYNFLRYVFVWFFYASNLSSMHILFAMGQYRHLRKIVLETAWYCVFVAGFVKVFGWSFALCTVIYAFLEGNIMLALINWVWHMFIEIDPASNKPNEFIESTTIMEGEHFIFNEEYHVVHHQYPGIHWQLYPKMFEKHRSSYDIIFEKENIYVLGFTAMFKNYEKLAGMVKNPTINEKGENITASILKRRLQTTVW